MSRAAWLLVLAGIVGGAGCGGSVCDGFDGTCLELTVHSRTLVEISQLGFTAGAPLQTATAFTDAVKGTRPFPILAALHLPPGPTGDVPITIDAFLDDVRIGTGAFVVSIPRVGIHESAVASVERLDDVLHMDTDDGGASEDGPSRDEGIAQDLASADLSNVDLAGADLPSGPRYLFLVGPIGGAHSGATAPDARCQSAWDTSGRGGVAVALLGRAAGGDPSAHASFLPSSTRPVLLPSGAQVAIEGGFFTSTHTHAIDQLLDGTPIASACVWTAFSAAGTHASEPTCADWTSNSGGLDGATGSTSATDATWAAQASLACSASCYLYCVTE